MVPAGVGVWDKATSSGRKVRGGRSVGSRGDGTGRQGRLPGLFCCRAGGESRALDLGNTERREGPQALWFPAGTVSELTWGCLLGGAIFLSCYAGGVFQVNACTFHSSDFYCPFVVPPHGTSLLGNAFAGYLFHSSISSTKNRALPPAYC